MYVVVTALLTAYPGGAKEKDDDGDMPLHYAAIKGAPFNVMKLLLGANPEAVTKADGVRR